MNWQDWDFRVQSTPKPETEPHEGRAVQRRNLSPDGAEYDDRTVWLQFVLRLRDSVKAHLALIVALRELYNTSSVELTEKMYSPVQTDKLQVVLGQSRYSQRASNDSILFVVANSSGRACGASCNRTNTSVIGNWQFDSGTESTSRRVNSNKSE